MNDTPTGFDRAPDRYTAHGREMIDRMRDLAHEAAPLVAIMVAAPVDLVKLGDLMFAYHCGATALKYEDRAGLKDDADQDARKAAFYRQMERHILNPTEHADPRANRPGFVPYVRP